MGGRAGSAAGRASADNRAPSSGPLHVLLLTDGRPGHYRISEGIVAALARRFELETTRLEVRRRGPGLLAAAAVNIGLRAEHVLGQVHGMAGSELPACNLIVSAGAETLAANVAAARITGAPNIFYGSLRWFRPQHFALVLTSYARNAGRPSHALALKPTPIDPDALPAPARLGPGAPPRTLGLLIGGPARGIRFSGRDWSALDGTILATGREWGARWHVTTSRRTPGEVADRLAALARMPGGPVARFIDVRHAGSGTIVDVIGPAAALLCTADSSSMVSEAVATRRPVVVLEPERFRLPPAEQDYRGWMARSGWTRSLPLSGLTAAALNEALLACTPLERHPWDELADTVIACIPGLAARLATRASN